MPTVKRLSVFDVVSQLPDWQLSGPIPQADLFIAAAGFEERSATAFLAWSAQAPRGSLAVLVRYPYNREDNEKHEKQFEDAARTAGIRLEWINYDRIAFGGLLKGVLESNRGREVLIDISTMASFVFYPLFQWLLQLMPSDKICVIYTEAIDYYPSEDEWRLFQSKTAGMEMLEKARAFDESHFQSQGIDAIYEPFGFEGCNPDNMLTALVVVPNFSFERINRMIDYAKERYPDSSSDTVWLIGKPPEEAKHGWRFAAVRDMYSNPPHAKPICTLNYKEMMLGLDAVWRERSLTNSLMILTAGSKCQHLGTVLFHMMHPDVGVILSEPTKFTADRYSSKAGRQWTLRFGADLTSKLRAWNSFVFSW